MVLAFFYGKSSILNIKIGVVDTLSVDEEGCNSPIAVVNETHSYFIYTNIQPKLKYNFSVSGSINMS